MMGSMVSCWWDSVDQTTVVVLEVELVVYWLGCVGDRIGKSDKEMFG